MPERTGIVTRAGHICMICSFIPTTKNKYRELQDHLVRKHFNDRIKAVMPIRRPYMCPEPNCTIEGKDWQALMRHYTGKHGVLEAFLKEVIDSGHTLPPNPKHAKKNMNKNKIQAQQPPEQPQQVQLQQQQQPLEAVNQANANQNTLSLPPECNNRRRKLSHNSTGSASSPESLQEEEDPQQPQQLALIVKRRRPNGEESIALIDLNCFLASSTYIPYPEPQLLAAAAGKNTHFNVLATDFFDEDMKQEDINTQQQQEQLIQQQLAQQQPTLFAHDQLHQVQLLSPQQLEDQQSQAQQEHEQQLKEIEQHLQLDVQQDQQQQQQQLHLQSSEELVDDGVQQHMVQLVDESDPQQQLHFQTSEIIELSDEQFEQTLVPIYVTPSGEVIQLPYLTSLPFQDGESSAFQIIQTIPARATAGSGASASLAMVGSSSHQQHQQIFHVQQQQQTVNAIDDNYLRPIEVVNNDRVIVEEVPVFTIDNSAMAAIDEVPKEDSSSQNADLSAAKEQELTFGMY